MNPYRSIKLNLYRVDNLVTLALVAVSGACAIKGFIHLSYGVLSCTFIIFFIEMLCEGKSKENRAEYCHCGCECVKTHHIDEKLTFWCILSALSVVLAGVFKGESLLLVLLAGLCIISACQPYGISFYTNALENRFSNILDKLDCTIQDGAPFSILAYCKSFYIEDKCILSGEDCIVEQIYTDFYSIDITGGTNSVLGEFFQNGRAVRIKNSPSLTMLLDIGILCGNGALKKGTQPNWIDNKVYPTGTNEEKAFLIAAGKAGRFAENIPYTRLFKAEPLKNTTLKYAIAENNSGKRILVATGDFSDMITRCDFSLTDTGTYPLNPQDKTNIKETVNNIILSGGRPILAAFCTLNGNDTPEKSLSGLTYVGIFSLKAPISQSTLGALERLKREGIIPIIFSKTNKGNQNKFSNHPEIKFTDVTKLKEDIPICYHQNSLKNENVEVVMGEKCSPNIMLSEKGLMVLPNLIHGIRKLQISIESVTISLVSSAFILCICTLFSAAVGLPVAAFPIYIMNYFLTTSIFMVALLVFIPYKHSYAKPYRKSRIPLDGEVVFKIFLRGALCAVLCVEMFTVALSHTNSSLNAVTCLALTSILTQVMAIVESRLVYTKWIFVLLEKILFSSICCIAVYALTSINLVASLSGLAHLPLECILMCLGSSILCDILSSMFFIKLK